MSPEQARGNALDVDARTDIFGLGATMFTLLTGRYLHAASAAQNLVEAAATEPIQPILSLAPEMFPPLAAIIERAVMSDKERRWPNARAMLAELSTIEAPAVEIRDVRVSISEQGATMSTAPSSPLSWSRARKVERSDDSTRRQGWLLGGALTIAGSLLAFSGGLWSRSEAAPVTSVPPAVQSVRPSATPPASAASPPAAVQVARSDRLVPPLTRPIATRLSPPKHRAAPKAAVEGPPSPPPRTPDATAERDFAIPDDVLDRRE
jgi:hypothetical protein